MRHCFHCSKRACTIRVVAAFLLTFGWLFNIASVVSCNFVTVHDGLETDLELVYAMGLYTVQGKDGYCYVVNWSEFTRNVPYWTNRNMISARTCGSIAAFVGFMIMIFAWFLPCFPGGKRRFRLFSGPLALICCLLSCFMFLVNSSSICESSGCKFSQGSGLAVGAVLFYYCAGILLCIFAPINKQVGDKKEAVEEETLESPTSSSDKEAQISVESSSVSLLSMESVDSSNLLEARDQCIQDRAVV